MPSETTVYEVYDGDRLIDTLRSERTALKSAEECGDDTTTVVMVVTSGSHKSRTTIYPKVGETRTR